MRPFRTGSGGRTASAAVFAAMVLACGALAQQQPGLVVVSPRPELKWLDFYFLDAAIELEWRRNVSQVDPQTGGTIRDTQDRFRQILELDTRGYVGHPNLLELDLSGAFWFTQRLLDLDSTATNETLNEFLFNYDFSGLFFPQQKFPVSVYTKRNQSDIDRVFGSSLEQIWTETGARLTVRDTTFPTNVHVFTRRLEQKDVGFNQNFILDQNTFDANGRVELGAAQSLWWDFSYDDIDQEGDRFLPRAFDRIEGNLTHTFDFGETEQHQLRSVFRYFDESGDFGFRQFLFNPRLRLRPNSSLQTWFDYRFEDLTRSTLELQRHDASANFRHQLYDSLVTTGRLGGIHQDIPTDSFQSNEVDADLRFDYTKRVPLGTLYGGADLNWSRIWQTERGVPIPVFGQPFSFPPTDLIIIFEENVIDTSIVVRDITGTIIYIPPFPNGDVLIDYAIGPEPAGTTTTAGAGADLRYTFDEGALRGLSVYGRYFRQDQDRSPEAFATGLVDNDFTDVVYGVEYNLWKFYFRAEQQIRDSELSPFDSTWLEGRFVQPLGRGSSVVLSANYQQIDRTDVDIRTATTTVSGRWDQQFTDQLRMSLLVLYQNIDGNVGLASEAWEQRLDLTWRLRQTLFYAQLRNRWRDNTGADDTFFQTIFVGLRREF
jgi:hypothetical protein